MASFTGTWQVVSSPDFDEGYLRMEVAPYVILKQSGDRVEGKYQVGLQTGTLDGWLERQNLMLFSFEGMDELEEMHGERGSPDFRAEVLPGRRVRLRLRVV